MDPVRVTASSGKIRVIAEARGDVVVERGQDHPLGGVLEVTSERRSADDTRKLLVLMKDGASE